LSRYVEFQDLHVRVNTGDASVGAYTSKLLKVIDPDGNESPLTATAENVTWLGADLDKAKFIRGWWRFQATAINLLGKQRKTKWYKLWCDGEGDVVG
jgi:hypothetical protein